MRIRQPIAWGSVAALLAAAAFAQQPGSSTPRPRQNAGADTRTDDARMYRLNNSTDPKAALGQLEGVWKVEMRINPTQWLNTHPMRGTQGMNHDGLNHDAASGMTGDQPTTGSTRTTPATTPSTANPSTAAPGSNEPNAGERPGFQPQPHAPSTTHPATTPATGTPAGTAPNPGTTTRSQPTDSANNQTASGDANRTGMNNQNRTTGSTTDHAAWPAGTIVQGYSEKRWIMGDDILQETFVVPDLGTDLVNRGGTSSNRNVNTIDDHRDAAGNREAGDNRDNAANRDAAGNRVPAAQPADDSDGTPSVESYEAGRLFKTMSFLAFNEGTQRFDYVCMDSREGGIKHAAGTYDAASNRIEFNVTDVMGGGHEMGHSGITGATGVDANRPYDPTNPRGTGEYDPSNPRGSMATPTPATTGTPSGTNAGQPARTNDPNRTSDPTRANDPNRTTDLTRTTDANRTGSGNTTNNTNAGMGQPNQRGEWSNQQAMKDDNFRIAVEILSADQHRVTMYRNAGSESWQERQDWSRLDSTPATTTTPANDATRPGTTRPDGTIATGTTPRTTTGNQPATTPGTTPATTTGTAPTSTQPRTSTTQPGSLAWDTSFESPYGVIVWQATYTRANGAEAARYRQNLLRADQVMQTTAEVQTER